MSWKSPKLDYSKTFTAAGGCRFPPPSSRASRSLISTTLSNVVEALRIECHAIGTLVHGNARIGRTNENPTTARKPFVGEWFLRLGMVEPSKELIVSLRYLGFLFARRLRTESRY